MESSRKSSCNDLLERVAEALTPEVPAGSSILVGLSGGVDSVVLLHLLRQLSENHSWRLSALHVHHGISLQADAWVVFCTELCAHEGIPLQIEQVDITPMRHLGVEAAARTLRHAALARQQADFIALAHHQDDQAETLLLQLLRGSGVRGVSAMPALKRRDGVSALVRPLLNIPRSALIEYAQRHGLKWVEDESNDDDAYPRNFLRHRVLPLLEQRFPAYRATLARSARHFAEASELLDDLARQDARNILPSPASGRGARGRGGEFAEHALRPLSGSGLPAGTRTASEGEGTISLEIARLQALSHPRAKNLLRYFIAARGAPLPDSTLLEEMLHQIVAARQDAQVCIAWHDWQMRCYRGYVHIQPALPPPVDFSIIWRGEAEIQLPPPHGRLRFERTSGQGISTAKLQSGSMEIHPRRGGEKLRPDAARPQRTLKNLLQEHDILPWQRDVLPLLFYDADLVCVPGVAIASAYRAQPGEAGIVVNWRA